MTDQRELGGDGEMRDDAAASPAEVGRETGDAGDADAPPPPVAEVEAAAEEAVAALARVEAADAEARIAAAPDLPERAFVAASTDDRVVREPGLPWRMVACVALAGLALNLASLVYVAERAGGGGVQSLRGWPRGFWSAWTPGATSASAGPAGFHPLPFLANWVIWIALVCAVYASARLIRQSARERPSGRR